MEKNDRNIKKEVDESSIFYYDELTLLVLSHLSIADLLTVKNVSKKWNDLVHKPEIWKAIVVGTFGVFIGPEYLNIISKSSVGDMITALKDPAFARTFFNMEKYVVLDGNQEEWNRAYFGIPREIEKKTLLDRLFSDKPIWRSPWLTNNLSATNSRLFLLPYFQPHRFPQADSLFTQLFFFLLIADVKQIITAQELWGVLEARAKTADRPKAIATMCHWLANFNWKDYSALLDPLLDQFLETATSEEREQIERAKHLGTLSRVYDWEKHDRAYMEKRKLKFLPANIKPKLLNQPIDLLHIPAQEMAKQIALREQKLFRDLTLDFFVYRRWMVAPNNAFVGRFNKVTTGLIHWILTQKSMDKRCETISYLIHLGHELIQLRCVSGVMMIYATLDNSCVMRLNSTKKMTIKHATEFDEIRRVLSPDAGYRGLREFMQITDQPMTPFLGMTLTDLTFIEDGNGWYTPAGQVNMRKLVMYMETICSCLRHQLVPYLFEPVEPLQQLWEDFALVTMDEDQLYELSAALKPRGSDKEKDHPPKKK
jgi:hypothetical protein